MKRVYALTRGCYSDYSVVGIFSSLENLETYQEKFPGEDYNEQEDYVLDDYISGIKKGYSLYTVVLNLDTGDLIKLTKDGGIPSGILTWTVGNIRHFDVDVMARDEKHAIKIANEKRILEKL